MGRVNTAKRRGPANCNDVKKPKHEGWRAAVAKLRGCSHTLHKLSPKPTT